MGFLARLLSFEKPMGPALVQFLYLLAITWIVLKGLWRIFGGIGDLADDFLHAVWQIVSAPFLALLAILVVRVIAECLRAVLRIDTSLREIVTGRAAPGPLTGPASPDQSED